MPIAPKLVGKPVSYATGLDVFVTGYLHLTLMPPSAPPAAIVAAQDPIGGTYIDVGGTVTAMVNNQVLRSKSSGPKGG